MGIEVGCIGGHPIRTYQFLYLKTSTFCLDKDVTFLNKTYDDWDKVESPVIVQINYEGSDEKEVEMIPKNNDSNNIMI